MATITLEYDARNAAIKKILEAIILLGVKVKVEKSELEKSIEDVERGRTHKAKSVKDLMQKING